MISVFHDFLSPERCAPYKERVSAHYKNRVEQGFHPLDMFQSRNIDISDDPIGPQVKAFIEHKIKVRLTWHQIQLQTWPIDCPVGLHGHDHLLKEGGDYNSIIYLHSDFTGGEFYTSNGITIAPKTGMLTFFHGSKIQHGIKPIGGKHRHSIIFWWKNTQWL